MAKGFKKEDGHGGHKFIPTEDKSKKISSNDVKTKKSDSVDSSDSETLKNKKLVSKNAKEFDVTVPVIDELRKLEEDDDILIDDIQDEDNSRYLTLSNGATYYLYEDYNAMKNVAEERIRDDLENEPSLFNQDWLDGFMEVSDTDARMFAIDLAESRLEGVEDEVAEKLEEDVRQEISDHEDDDDFEEQVDKLVEDRLDEALDKRRSEITDEIEATIKNNGLRNFIVNDEGLCRDEDFMEQYGNYMHVDYESAIDSAISTDGVEHFISSYDGESHETSDGQYLVKHND